MATFDELKTAFTNVAANLDVMDTKLDEIRDFIANLQGGASQAQINELAAMVGVAKDKSDAVVAELDALDETP